MTLMPFHLSIPVSDLANARAFYGDLLGCSEGRSGEKRIDFNFFGHHLVTHLEPDDAAHQTTNILSDNVRTPCRHFGVVISSDDWTKLVDRLQAAGAHFYMEPQLLNAGQVKEQHIMLVHDNCGNIVEFKGMPRERLFAKSL